MTDGLDSVSFPIEGVSDMTLNRCLLAACALACTLALLALGAMAAYGSDEDASAPAYTLSASIGDNPTDPSSDISLDSVGTAKVENWASGEAKYLRVNVARNTGVQFASGTSYQVVITLPEQMYFRDDYTSIGQGFATGVSFDKNAVQDGRNYTINERSGTLTITLDSSQTNISFSLAVGYDSALAGRFSTSVPITATDTAPIDVALNEVADGASRQIGHAALGSATAAATANLNHSILYATSADGNYSGSTLNRGYEASAFISLYSGSSDLTALDRFYTSLKVTMTLPKATISNKTYYLEYVTGTVSSDLGSYSESVDPANHTVTFTFTDVNTKNLSTLIQGIQVKLAIGNPEVGSSYRPSFTITARDLAGNEGTILDAYTSYSIMYGTAAENVTIASTDNDRQVTADGGEVVNFLGDFQISNAGAGDSTPKKVTLSLAYSDTYRNMHVTTVRLPTDTLQQKILVTYTLINASGETKSGSTEIDNDSYNGSPDNASTLLTRSMLLNDTNYFIKQIEYEIKSIPGSTMLYRYGNENQSNSAGCFYGYYVGGAGTRALSTVRITDTEDSAKTQAVGITTRGTTNTDSGWEMDASLSSSSITAGQSSVLTLSLVNNAKLVDYNRNTGCHWLDNIVVALELPEGLSVSDNGVSLKSNTEASVGVDKVEQVSGAATSLGMVLWKIYFKGGTKFGNFKENLSSLDGGDRLSISIRLDADSLMQATSTAMKSNIYVAGLGQRNNRGHTSGIVDKYDINEVGGTTDRIIGSKTDPTLTVSQATAQLITSNSLTVTHADGTSETDDKVTAYTEHDTFSSDFTITGPAGGYAEDLVWYLPVAKANSVKDERWQVQTGAFDLAMTGAATLNRIDLFDVCYAVDSKAYGDYVQDETSPGGITWYTADQIDEGKDVSWSDVAVVKIVQKADTKISADDSITVSLPLGYQAATGSSYEQDAAADANMNVWMSSGHYVYANGSTMTSGHFTASKNAVELKNIEFSFTKVAKEDTTRPLEGAEFSLYRLTCADPQNHDHSGVIDTAAADSCWVKVDAYAGDGSSSAASTFAYSQLLPGEYRLVETKAPFARLVPSGQWSVTVKSDGTLKFDTVGDRMDGLDITEDSGTYLVPNSLGVALPSTGGPGMLLLAPAVLLVIGSAAALAVRQRCRAS